MCYWTDGQMGKSSEIKGEMKIKWHETARERKRAIKSQCMYVCMRYPEERGGVAALSQALNGMDGHFGLSSFHH